MFLPSDPLPETFFYLALFGQTGSNSYEQSVNSKQTVPAVVNIWQSLKVNGCLYWSIGVKIVKILKGSSC